MGFHVAKAVKSSSGTVQLCSHRLVAYPDLYPIQKRTNFTSVQTIDIKRPTAETLAILGDVELARWLAKPFNI